MKLKEVRRRCLKVVKLIEFLRRASRTKEGEKVRIGIKVKRRALTRIEE